jgi:hypothetical protein
VRGFTRQCGSAKVVGMHIPSSAFRRARFFSYSTRSSPCKEASCQCTGVYDSVHAGAAAACTYLKRFAVQIFAP